MLNSNQIDDASHLHLPSHLQAPPQGSDIIQDALRTIRTHLGMEVAYLSEFVDGQSVFRNVDAPGLEEIIKPGDTRCLDEVYCKHILEGRLPNLIPDTSREAVCRALPITKDVPIGSHISLPIHLNDGSVYGMFCCLSPTPNTTLNMRDMQTMQIFADLVTRQVNSNWDNAVFSKAVKARILDVMKRKAFKMAYQPICSLKSRKPIGYEALARFSDRPYRSPDLWFKEAAITGLAIDLEISAIDMALTNLQQLSKGQYLSVNASPETVMSPQFGEVIAPYPLENLLIEITEHVEIDDYTPLLLRLTALRARGVKLAVDDAGAGHSSLRHIVKLQPDIVKLDMSLTRNIDSEMSQRAMVAALVRYAEEAGCDIIAEGVETEAECVTLRDIGISKGQGWLFGRPTPYLPSKRPIIRRTA